MTLCETPARFSPGIDTGLLVTLTLPDFRDACNRVRGLPVKSQFHQNHQDFCQGIQWRQGFKEKNTLKYKQKLFYRYFKHILKQVFRECSSVDVTITLCMNNSSFLQHCSELDKLSANKTRDICKSDLKPFFFLNKMIKSWRNTSIWKNLTPTGHHKDTSNTIKQEVLKKA